MDDKIKWYIGGGVALAALLWWYWRSQSQGQKALAPAQPACNAVEEATYRQIPYQIETCQGPEALLYYAKIMPPEAEAMRSMSWPSRDQAFGWAKETIDARLGGTPPPDPRPPAQPLGAVPADPIKRVPFVWEGGA